MKPPEVVTTLRRDDGEGVPRGLLFIVFKDVELDGGGDALVEGHVDRLLCIDFNVFFTVTFVVSDEITQLGGIALTLIDRIYGMTLNGMRIFHGCDHRTKQFDDV